MKERPILYSAPMVCAALDGRKTQTRRIINRINGIGLITDLQISDTAGYDWAMRDKRMLWHDLKNADLLVRCPYGKPGDRLWVKENWKTIRTLDKCKPSNLVCGTGIEYVAGGTNLASGNRLENTGKLRPSIFMPRWASRILLEVTNVRVERLNAISEKDAIAEGLKVCPNMNGRAGSIGYVWPDSPYDKSGLCHSLPVTAFGQGWEIINGQGSWDLNPLVWVVEFKVLRTTRAAA